MDTRGRWQVRWFVALLCLSNVFPTGKAGLAQAAWHQDGPFVEQDTAQRSNYRQIMDKESDTPGADEEQLRVEEDRRSAIPHAEELAYMNQLYTLRNHELRAARVLLHGESKCRSPASTVVHSYPYLGLQGHYLHFKVHKTHHTEQLCHGSLRVFFTSTGGQYTAGYLFRRRAALLIRFDISVIDPSSNGSVLITSQTHVIQSQEYSGWFTFDVSEALRMHRAHSDGAFQLLLMPILQLYSGDAKVRITLNAGHQKHPQLVVHNYVDPKEADVSFLEAMQRVKAQQDMQQASQPRAMQSPTTQDTVQHQRQQRRPRRRRQKRSPYFRRHCQLYRHVVPMSSIGFRHAIVPSYFPMTHCQGACSHPILQPVETSAHGQIMSLLSTMGRRRRRKAPEPCCAPSGALAGLDIIYFWPFGGFTIRYHSEMIAVACGCN